LIRKHDPTLFPEDDAAQRRADMLDGVLTDIWSNLVAVCYINTVGEYCRNIQLRRGVLLPKSVKNNL